jgi:hypothetical protein
MAGSDGLTIAIASWLPLGEKELPEKVVRQNPPQFVSSEVSRKKDQI